LTYWLANLTFNKMYLLSKKSFFRN
jgi:hypothetical protein